MFAFGCAGEPGCADVASPPFSVVTRREGERSGEEKDRRYSAMKKSSLRAQKRKSTVCPIPILASPTPSGCGPTHLICIIQMQHPTPTSLHLLMTLPPSRQTCIHMHIMACEVQTDEALEHNAPPWERARQEHEQAGGRASVCHHVQHGAEGGGLIVFPRGEPVGSVEDAGERVQEGAGAWVEGHVVEGGEGEDDPDVAYITLVFGCAGRDCLR